MRAGGATDGRQGDESGRNRRRKRRQGGDEHRLLYRSVPTRRLEAYKLEISDKLLCLFSADVSDDGDGSGENNGDGTGEPYDWRDVARPMPYGLTDGPDGPEGETFEWALRTDDCGDCRFYAEDESETGEGGPGRCTVHADRPLVCRTYPFSVALGGTSQPMGEAVDSAGPAVPRADGTAADGSIDGEGVVRAHECEGLGRDISRTEAEELATTLKERAVRELEEAIAVRDGYEPVATGPGGVVVHDSEGAKRPDGSPVER